LDDVREEAQFVGFVFLVEREIRIVPIAEHAEAFKLLALDVDVFARVGIARFANRGGAVKRCFRHLAGSSSSSWSLIRRQDAGSTLFAHVLRDLEFNRQAVAIPAGN